MTKITKMYHFLLNTTDAFYETKRIVAVDLDPPFQ